MLKNAIITGGSGMIGSVVLQHCLHSEEIESVTSIVRKSSGISDPKLREVICQDFLCYNDLEKNFTDQHIGYYCIGAYTGQLPDQRFKEITVDFTRVFAGTLKRYSPQAVFCFLSGAGADQAEKSRVSFARYKGMAENCLIQQDFPSLYLFRPGYIYPVRKRNEPNLSYRLMRRFYPLIRILGRQYSVTSAELGEAMFRAGVNGAGKEVLENRDILGILSK